MCGGVVSFWSLTNQTWENEMRDLIKLMNIFYTRTCIIFWYIQKENCVKAQAFVREIIRSYKRIMSLCSTDPPNQ
jgi:hypothetical protein